MPCDCARLTLIEDWTEDILKQYMRLTGEPLPLPVPLFEIAERLFGLRCDVEGLRGRLEGASGVFISDKRWVILNKRQTSTRLRFTLARELAPWLIDHEEFEQGNHGLEHISGLQTNHENLRERRANHVASALLMPRAVILAEASRRTDIGTAELSAMAFAFGVSQPAMQIRLHQFEDELCRLGISLLSLGQGEQEISASHSRSETSDESQPRAAMVRVDYRDRPRRKKGNLRHERRRHS